MLRIQLAEVLRSIQSRDYGSEELFLLSSFKYIIIRLTAQERATDFENLFLDHTVQFFVRDSTNRTCK